MNIRFSHPTKTGGSSVVKGLRTRYKNTPHTHKPFISKSVYDKKGYDFSFATVRNPYDRTMSIYNYFDVINKNMSFDTFLTELEEKGYCSKGNRMWVTPQNHYVYCEGNKVDDIIRLESFDEDWGRVFSEKLGLNIEPINTNKTKEKIIKSLTTKQKEIIYQVYQKDFELLNYEK